MEKAVEEAVVEEAVEEAVVEEAAVEVAAEEDSSSEEELPRFAPVVGLNLDSAAEEDEEGAAHSAGEGEEAADAGEEAIDSDAHSACEEASVGSGRVTPPADPLPPADPPPPPHRFLRASVQTSRYGFSPRPPCLSLPSPASLLHILCQA